MATRNLNLKFNDQHQLGVDNHLTREHVPVSNRYGWSTHNCSCQNKSKTGLVLYPSNLNHKNIVLLVCENCYGYRKSQRTQHQQLADWYFGIYGDAKSFVFTSGFYIKEDGQLGFNSNTFNASNSCPYRTTNRKMGPLEQDIVRQVVQGKLDSYSVKS